MAQTGTERGPGPITVSWPVVSNVKRYNLIGTHSTENPFLALHPISPILFTLSGPSVTQKPLRK